jgi:hypothetical protein
LQKLAQPDCNPNSTQTTKHQMQNSPLEVVVLSKLSLLQTEKNKPNKPAKLKYHKTTIYPQGLGELGK